MIETDQVDIGISHGSILGCCRKVEDFFGEGGFGLVCLCRHVVTNRTEAIKVNKSHPQTKRQAKQEIAILKELRRLDPDTSNIVRWNGYFLHNEHVCLSFEPLDQSLYHYMKDRWFAALPVREVKPILHQLASALLQLGSLGIVHADLKPENVMIADRRQRPLRVKIIDFGLALNLGAAVPGLCVQTTWYRAPEVMLHMPFNEAIDMWSLGLTAVELATGYPLYPGNMNYDVLRFIVETQGQPADYILDRGFETRLYFWYEEHSRQRWRFKSPEEFRHETRLTAQETRGLKLKSLQDLERHMRTSTGPDNSDQHLLLNLIKGMLDLDADQRVKPQEVLQHPFFVSRLPWSSHVDVLNEPGSNEAEKAGASQLHPQGLTAAPRSTPPKFRALCQPLPASPKGKGEERIQIETELDIQPIGQFRRLTREITNAFRIY